MFKAILKSLLAASTVFLSVSISHAQENGDDPNEDHIAVGIGYLDQHTPFNSASTQTNLIPFISIKLGAYYFEGAETGFHLDKVSGGMTSSLDVFVAARSPLGQDRRKLSVDGGARLSLDTKMGKLSAEFHRDATDKFNGLEVIARYSYPLSSGRFTLIPAVQASWLDRKAANYVYGVTAQQRARTIRKARRVILPVAPITDEALNLGGDIAMLVKFNDRLTLTAIVGGAYLDKSIQRSAAIEQKWEAQSGLGLTYTF
jgi:outer membrane scaffolding protein for murein synthesis (MipA/OmpV family)